MSSVGGWASLLRCQPVDGGDGEGDVGGALRGIPEAKVAHNVYGLYDVITQIEAETQDELGRVLGQRIRRIEGVRSTITMRVSS